MPTPQHAAPNRQLYIIASECDDAQRAFGGVVVDLELAVVDIAGKCLPARGGVANRRRGIRLARELRERVFHPGAHTVEQRFCSCLTNRAAYLRRAASDLGLDGIEHGDALYRLCTRRRRVRDMDLVELASGMSPTRDFVDRSSFVELLEACEGIGLVQPLRAPRRLCTTIW